MPEFLGNSREPDRRVRSEVSSVAGPAGLSAFGVDNADDRLGSLTPSKGHFAQRVRSISDSIVVVQRFLVAGTSGRQANGQVRTVGLLASTPENRFCDVWNWSSPWAPGSATPGNPDRSLRLGWRGDTVTRRDSRLYTRRKLQSPAMGSPGVSSVGGPTKRGKFLHAKARRDAGPRTRKKSSRASLILDS